MLSTLFFASAATAKFAVTVNLHTSTDGSCGGGRVLHAALEVDICAISPEICQMIPPCDKLGDMLGGLGLPIKFGECMSLSSLTALLGGGEDSGDDSGTPALRRFASSPEAAAVANELQGFLMDVVAPVARRRLMPPGVPDISGGIPDMNNLPFGDILLKCGGDSVGVAAAMSAGAAAGMTVGVVIAIIVIALAVMCYGYKVKGYRVAKPEIEGNQGVEMNAPSSTPKGQWQTDTPKGETNNGETEQV